VGLDLTLCVNRFHIDNGSPFSNKWFLAYDRLGTHRDGLLTPEVEKFKAKKLPEDVKFEWYGDEGLEVTKTDPYDSPLTYVPASEFKKINTKKMDTWNKAVVKFIASLAPNTPVILYWH
jgi:hypothetical protein